MPKTKRPKHWYVVSQRGTLTYINTIKAEDGMTAKRVAAAVVGVPVGALVVRMAKGDEVKAAEAT